MSATTNDVVAVEIAAEQAHVDRVYDELARRGPPDPASPADLRAELAALLAA